MKTRLLHWRLWCNYCLLHSVCANAITYVDIYKKILMPMVHKIAGRGIDKAITLKTWTPFLDHLASAGVLTFVVKNYFWRW
ncbi:hypothetical protein Dimus_006637 [Dionaea muscipula]